MRLLSAHFSTVVIILFISHLPISTSSNLSLGGVDRSEPLLVCTGLISARSLAAVIRKLFCAAQQFFRSWKKLGFFCPMPLVNLFCNAQQVPASDSEVIWFRLQIMEDKLSQQIKNGAVELSRATDKFTEQLNRAWNCLAVMLKY